MTGNPQITFVCCVESGWLEDQTVRMIESLRRWGGQLANSPMIAVTPRFGSPLSHKTHQAFKRLQVQYLRVPAKSKYSWFPYLNKPSSLVAAEEHSTTECVAWLDSDLLFVDEPEKFILNQGEDFVACASDKNAGTSNPEDLFEPYWNKICQVLGIDIEDLPWITTEIEGIRIRLYWNGGIFVYRRSTDFGNHYLQNCIQLLDERIITKTPGFTLGIHEQSAVGLTMVKLGLPWRALPGSHNYATGSIDPTKWNIEEKLKAARVLHYHDSMWPSFWPEFIKTLRTTHQPVANWLDSLSPMKNEAPFHWRITNQLLKKFRVRQESAYKESCKVI